MCFRCEFLMGHVLKRFVAKVNIFIFCICQKKSYVSGLLFFPNANEDLDKIQKYPNITLLCLWSTIMKALLKLHALTFASMDVP